MWMDEVIWEFRCLLSLLVFNCIWVWQVISSPWESSFINRSNPIVTTLRRKTISDQEIKQTAHTEGARVLLSLWGPLHHSQSQLSISGTVYVGREAIWGCLRGKTGNPWIWFSYWEKPCELWRLVGHGRSFHHIWGRVQEKQESWGRNHLRMRGGWKQLKQIRTDELLGTSGETRQKSNHWRIKLCKPNKQQTRTKIFYTTGLKQHTVLQPVSIQRVQMCNNKDINGSFNSV